MSPRAKALKNLYMHHKITQAGLLQAVEDGIITQAEYELIIGE